MRVSIVTAVYSAEETLEDTILSVYGQDYADIEHIIVDGESTADLETGLTPRGQNWK